MNQIWKPFPKQEKALLSNAFETLFGGARGGGKTETGIVWLTYGIENPNYRALVIRKNADDLSDWVDRARKFYKLLKAEFAYRPPIITFPNGAIIRTGHLKDDQAYTKYQGHEYHRMLIEELTQIPDEKRYLQLIASCRSTVDGLRPQIFLTTNPGGLGHNWVKERFVDPSKSGVPFKDPISGRERVFIRATLDDNPVLQEKDPGYIKMLDALKERDEELWKAWRLGDWDVFAGQFFSEFRRDLHVVEPFALPDYWDRYMALDWGSNKPLSLGWYAVTPDGRSYLYRELYMNSIEFELKFGKPLTAKRLARIAIAINRKNGEKINYCVADPSMWNKILLGKDTDYIEGESYAEVMLNEGMPMIQGDNNRMNGWGRVKEALSIAPDGKPYYQIFSTCNDTIRTYPTLIYDNIKVEDLDTDGDDHCQDRDRYFFMSRPPATDRQPKPKESKIQSDFKRRIKKLYQKDDYEETDEIFY